MSFAALAVTVLFISEQLPEEELDFEEEAGDTCLVAVAGAVLGKVCFAGVALSVMVGIGVTEGRDKII